MCGRFTHRLTWEQVHGLYNILVPDAGQRQGELELKPRFNAAPTDVLPVCRLNRSGSREIAMLRWGLIPYWADDPKIGYRTINARGETVATAPAFRAAFRKRRCLVPASGFYEWKKLAGGGKQPYLIQMRDGSPFSFAGLWERWDKGEAPIETFTIITGEPNSLAAELHDRMPVIIGPEDYDAWLTATDTTIPQALLQPFPSQLMTAYPVSTKVNSTKNDTPDLIEPLAPSAGTRGGRSEESDHGSR
jgi:putative SOS response-associated peptidase YedK